MIISTPSFICVVSRMNSVYTLKILLFLKVFLEPGSLVNISSGYGLDDRANEVRFPAEAGGFFF
jgi:hypothetical protein